MPTPKQFFRSFRNKTHYGIYTGASHRPTACGAKSKYRNTYSIIYDHVDCLKCLRIQAKKGSRVAKHTYVKEASRRNNLTFHKRSDKINHNSI